MPARVLEILQSNHGQMSKYDSQTQLSLDFFVERLRGKIQSCIVFWMICQNYFVKGARKRSGQNYIIWLIKLHCSRRRRGTKSLEWCRV